MTAVLKFPQIRWFGPHNSFQPQPIYKGEKLIGAPDFHTQSEAAYFNIVFFRLLNQPTPDYEVKLDLDKCAVVEAKVKDFIRLLRLEPDPIPTPAVLPVEALVAQQEEPTAKLAPARVGAFAPPEIPPDVPPPRRGG